MRAGYDAVLADRWSDIHAGFRAEALWRSRMLGRDGLLATLTSLSPSVRWQGTTMEIDFPGNVDLALNGHGVILRPSLFWTGYPLVGTHADGRLVLIYPALTPLPYANPVHPATPCHVARHHPGQCSTPARPAAHDQRRGPRTGDHRRRRVDAGQDFARGGAGQVLP